MLPTFAAEGAGSGDWDFPRVAGAASAWIAVEFAGFMEFWIDAVVAGAGAVLLEDLDLPRAVGAAFMEDAVFSFGALPR